MKQVIISGIRYMVLQCSCARLCVENKQRAYAYRPKHPSHNAGIEPILTIALAPFLPFERVVILSLQSS